MARINLLPWRAEQRERKNKEFITIVAVAALLAAALAFASWFFFNTEYKEQQQANANITAENAKLDIALKQIDDLENQKQQMIARMKVIQDLQGKRPLPVLVWDDLARSIPDALYLKTMEKLDDTITMTGKADNPNIVSKFITNLDNSKWMGSSSVNTIEEKEKNNNEEIIYPEDDYVNFEITTKIVSTATLEDINQSSNAVAGNTEDGQNQAAENESETTTDTPSDESETTTGSPNNSDKSVDSAESEKEVTSKETTESTNESEEQ